MHPANYNHGRPFEPYEQWNTVSLIMTTSISPLQVQEYLQSVKCFKCSVWTHSNQQTLEMLFVRTFCTLAKQIADRRDALISAFGLLIRGRLTISKFSSVAFMYPYLYDSLC